MKTLSYILLGAVCLIVGYVLGADFAPYKPSAVIDLPEEYELITEEDNLKAKWTTDKDSLIFYFSNPDNALVKPDYMIEFINHGDSVIIQSTGDNKLFTVPYDRMMETIELKNL